MLTLQRRLPETIEAGNVCGDIVVRCLVLGSVGARLANDAVGVWATACWARHGMWWGHDWVWCLCWDAEPLQAIRPGACGSGCAQGW